MLHPLTGIPRSKPQWRLPHMVPEFVAARICVEQIIDLRNTLRYLGVPICKKSYMFGDNESVVNSSSIPHAKLHKRHTALSFHHVQKVVASKYLGFYFLP